MSDEQTADGRRQLSAGIELVFEIKQPEAEESEDQQPQRSKQVKMTSQKNALAWEWDRVDMTGDGLLFAQVMPARPWVSQFSNPRFPR